MTMKWLCTTAILLTIGGGAAFAQSPADSQKSGEHHQSASPREPGRSAAGEEHMGGASKGSKGAEARSAEREGARESRGARGNETNSRAQAQQPSERQPNRQSEKMGRGERQPAAVTGQNEERGRPARGTEQSAQGRQTTSGRDQHPATKQSEQQQKEQSPRAAQSRQNPANERNGQTAQQDRNRATERDRNQATQPDRNQAAQPQKSGNPQANETTRPGESERQRQTVGQTPDRSGRAGQTSATSPNQGQRTSTNQDQRKQVVDRLRNDRDFARENQHIDMRVSVGERLPDNVRPRPLPPDIVQIVPQYRDYDYTVIDDRVAVVDPRTRDIVDVIDEGGGGYADRGYSQGYSASGSHITLSSDERQQLLKRAAPVTVGSNGGNSACITMQQVPEDLAQQHPELASDRYIAVGDQIVIVDPKQQKVVQVID